MVSMTKEQQFVAEFLLGQKRGKHDGSVGGGGTDVDSHWYCQWCGSKFSYSKNKPCPRFPFKSFTITDVMCALGKRGDPIVVRYDPYRERNHFTLCATQRICDTDSPLEALCDWAYRTWGLQGVEICPRCGTALGMVE